MGSAICGLVLASEGLPMENFALLYVVLVVEIVRFGDREG